MTLVAQKAIMNLSQKKQESVKEKVAHLPQIEFKGCNFFFSNIRRRTLKIDEQTIDSDFGNSEDLNKG